MKPRPQKYGAIKSVCAHGHTHDSRREQRKCDELHLMQRAKLISDLEVQKKFEFIIDGRPVKLKNGHIAGIVVDFVFTENGKKVALDSKGYTVRDFPLRWALAQHLYPDIEWRLG